MTSRFMGSRRSGTGEGNAPERFLPVFGLEKLDSVGEQSFAGADLGDDPRGDLEAALVAHDDGGSDGQLAVELDGGSTAIEIGGAGGDRKRSFLTVMARYANCRMQKHSIAAALRGCAARDGDMGHRLRFRSCFEKHLSGTSAKCFENMNSRCVRP